MISYPVNLNIQGRKCLVVGGGDTARRKIRSLLDCGAEVEVLSLDFAPELSTWSLNEPLSITRGPFTPDALKGAFLVVGATNNTEVNRGIAGHARKLGILCNIVDQPELSDFVVPAVVRRGDLIVAVSTSGKSPALARRLKERILESIPDAYVTLVQILGALRVHSALAQGDAHEHKKIWNSILDSSILQWIEAGESHKVESLLESILERRVTLEELGVNLEKRK